MAREPTQKGFREIWGILLVVLFLLLTMSLLTYDWRDVEVLKSPPSDIPHNWVGPAGAWLSFLLFMGFGVGAYLIPLWCLVFSVLFLKRDDRIWARIGWVALSMAALTTLLDLRYASFALLCSRLNLGSCAGGVFSTVITRRLLVPVLGLIGTSVLSVAAFLAGIVMFLGPASAGRVSLNAVGAFRFIFERFKVVVDRQMDRRRLIQMEEQMVAKQQRRLEKAVERGEEQMERATALVKAVEPAVEPASLSERPRPREKVAARPQQPASAEPQLATKPILTEYRFPPVSLLEEVPPSKDRAIKGDIPTTARILKETLEEFGIETEVANVEEGPVVTRYELRPAPGIRIERIVGLSNNLALALKATSVRVQAPIPGKGVVGVEVPNSTASMVYLREILEGECWANHKAALPLLLGKDVGGSDIIADLADMPHLLIAGATGSGKTVCMNSILAGFLMTFRPDDLRLMLIDPKIVEFSAFNNLPHLVAPVITNPKKVAIGLRWAIDEMEKRYKLFARVGTRNIVGYNSRPKQQSLLSGGTVDDDEGIPDKVPYIVIVVDELADLMLVAQADIENCVARLAQLSRAVGIHMILSTQRPSVNVITGTIKANFPSRIAFQVAQKVDSRTIIDANGAEKLLGDGDMLFQPPGTSKLVRAQGALTTDADIAGIVKFINDQAEPRYEISIVERTEGRTELMDDGEDEELLQQAIEIIRETQRASTSSLQRRLRIGYTRAARIIDILEDRGIVGPPHGSDPREILVDLDGEIPNNTGDTENVNA